MSMSKEKEVIVGKTIGVLIQSVTQALKMGILSEFEVDFGLQTDHGIIPMKLQLSRMKEIPPVEDTEANREGIKHMLEGMQTFKNYQSHIPTDVDPRLTEKKEQDGK